MTKDSMAVFQSIFQILCKNESRSLRHRDKNKIVIVIGSYMQNIKCLWHVSSVADKKLKPRPWGIKGENASFLPSISPAVNSFTPFIGVFIARLLINRKPYRWGWTARTRFLMSGFKHKGWSKLCDIEKKSKYWGDKERSQEISTRFTCMLIQETTVVSFILLDTMSS